MNKKTIVKVYASKESASSDFSNTAVFIGEDKDIDEYIKMHQYDEFYKEYVCKNSICDLADYGQFNARIEPGAIIRKSVMIEDQAVIMMGAIINKGAYIGSGTMIDMGCVIGGNVKIGKYCHIGAGSVLAGNIEPQSERCVEIGDDVFIGANAVILEGIHIGHHAIIGAGSIVLHDVDDYMVVAGNPAKVIKERDESSSNKTKINMSLR